MPRRRHNELHWSAEIIGDLVSSAVITAILYFVFDVPLWPHAIVGGLLLGTACWYCLAHIDWSRDDSGSSGRGGGGGSIFDRIFD